MDCVIMIFRVKSPFKQYLKNIGRIRPLFKADATVNCCPSSSIVKSLSYLSLDSRLNNIWITFCLWRKPPFQKWNDLKALVSWPEVLQTKYLSVWTWSHTQGKERVCMRRNVLLLMQMWSIVSQYFTVQVLPFFFLSFFCHFLVTLS